MDSFNFPTRSLHGRVAIVTGADFNKRITNGSAIAIMLARDGCNVVCIGTPSSDSEKPHASMAQIERTVSIINEERTKHTGPRPTEKNSQHPQAAQPQTQVQPRSLTSAIGANPGRAVAFGCDITNEDECEEAVQFALDTFGRLDILVNNAGINGPPGTAIDVNMGDWAYAMHFNVASMVHMAKYAVPAMQACGGKAGKAKSAGSIINMSSVTGMRGGAAHLLHPTSKSAIIGMSKTMAADFGSMDIRVNCVCPGIQYAPATFGEDALENMSLLGTEGTSGDVAAAVVFLSSDLSRWITGTEIVVDAGATSIVYVRPKPASKPAGKPAGISNTTPPDSQRPISIGTNGTNGTNGISNANTPVLVRTEGNDIKSTPGIKQPTTDARQLAIDARQPVNGVKMPVNGVKRPLPVSGLKQAAPRGK